jgi:hypothetical protein
MYVLATEYLSVLLLYAVAAGWTMTRVFLGRNMLALYLVPAIFRKEIELTFSFPLATKSFFSAENFTRVRA